MVPYTSNNSTSNKGKVGTQFDCIYVCYARTLFYVNPFGRIFFFIFKSWCFSCDSIQSYEINRIVPLMLINTIEIKLQNVCTKINLLQFFRPYLIHCVRNFYGFPLRLWNFIHVKLLFT